MLELKRERMSVFVENAREEIRALWEDLMDAGDFATKFDPEGSGLLDLIWPDFCPMVATRSSGLSASCTS